MSTRPLVFLDTETTGLGPSRQAWEIAALKRQDGRADEWLHLFVDAHIAYADQTSLRIGGYFERHPAGQELLGHQPAKGITHQSLAAKQVAAFTHGATIVGACPWFDTETLDPLLREHGYTPMWHYRLRDVEAMAAGFTGDPDLGGLHACADALGVTVDPAQEHTAVGDVLTAAAVYDAVILGNAELHAAVEAATRQAGA